MASDRSTGHPLVKAALVVGAAVLVVLVVRSLVMALFGIGWTILELALLAGVVAGVVHLVRRRRALQGGDQHGALSNRR